MTTIHEIATHPRAIDWVFYFIGFPGIACIPAIPFLLLLNAFYLKSPTGYAPLPASLAVLAFGVCVALWFLGRSINRQYWRLTDTELVGGLSRKIRFPLISIEKIIVGLPTDSLLSLQGGCLLLVFSDGTLLPLKLQSMPNGSELMRMLTERLKDRVVRNYSYSYDESRLLRRADPNALVRKK